MTEELAVVDPPVVLTAQQRERFLAIVAGNRGLGTRQALAQAGVSRPDSRNETARRSRRAPLTHQQVEAMFDHDPDLRDAYLQARQRHPEQIRACITDKAINGWEEPVYQGGKQVGTVWKFSPTLLLAMAKANLPEYRDTGRLEVTGGGGGPVVVQQGVSLADVAEVLRAARALNEPDEGDVVEHDGEPGELEEG